MGENGISDRRGKSEGLIRAAAQKASSLLKATRLPILLQQETPFGFDQPLKRFWGTAALCVF